MERREEEFLEGSEKRSSLRKIWRVSKSGPWSGTPYNGETPNPPPLYAHGPVRPRMRGTPQTLQNAIPS